VQVLAFSRRILFFLVAGILTLPGFLWADCAEGLSAVSRPGEILAAIETAKNGVETRAGKFDNFIIEYDPRLDTIRYQLAAARIPVGSQVIIAFHHGGGTTKSHSHAMMQPFHILTAKAARKSDLMKFLVALPSRLVIAGEAIDAPGHGLGPDPDRFPKLDDLVEWLATQIRELKKSGLPVIPLARSASTGYFLAVHQKYPGLLDGLILMSPVDPGVGMRVGVEALHQQENDGRLVINKKGLDFVQRMYSQMDWSNLKDQLKGLPVLVLIGGKDVETPKETQDLMRNLVEGSHPLSQFYFDPEAGHEVLSVIDKGIGLRSFTAVQNFIAAVVKF